MRTRLLLLAMLLGGGHLSGDARVLAQEDAVATVAVRITSPLGRTGIHGPIRIVAQVQHAAARRLQPVKFFVDERLARASRPRALHLPSSGRTKTRTRRVRLPSKPATTKGMCARDVVKLEPHVLLEEAEVSSVLVEASVFTSEGKSIAGLESEHFMVFEDDVPQALDLVRSDVVDSTYTLLIDSSQSMARRLDFVQRAAEKLLVHLRARDRVIVAPFSRTFQSVTGPTDDRATVRDAISEIHSSGGTAIMDVLDRPAGPAGRGDRASGGCADYRRVRRAQRQHVRGCAARRQIGTGDAVRSGRRRHRRHFAQGGAAAARHCGANRRSRFFPSRDEELPSVHQMIASDIRSRYLLAYTPSNRPHRRGWRKIAVKTADPEQVVRARPGYFAPKPPPMRATLEFTVATLDRRPVEISAADLMIVEDGVPQTLESFQEAVSPISIVLALDASGSMKGAVEAVKEGAKQFISAFRPQDRLSLVLFADESMLVHDLTTRRESTLQARRRVHRPRAARR